MHARTVPIFVAAVAALALPVQPVGASDDDVIRQLQEQVAELQDEVKDLRTDDRDGWLTEQRSEQIRGLVYDVLADADTRSSLLGSGMTAGWDKGFFLASADGNYKLKISGQIQVRHVMNNLDDGSPFVNDDGDPVDDSTRRGFEIRRAKLSFSGHVVDPSWKYKVKGAFDRSGGSSGGDFGLEDGYIEKDFGNGWALRGGQFKAPFLREELMSSSKQLLVDRSLVNEEYNQDFSQGVQLAYKGDAMRFYAMFGDGFASRNTPFLLTPAEYAWTGRVEWLGEGNWKQFGDFTSWEGDAFGWMLGGAVHYQKNETVMSGVDSFWSATVDLSMEFGGANLYTYFVYRDNDDTTGFADADTWGWVIQGGFFVVPDEWELFARYEYIDSDSTVEDLSIVTVGFNRYFAKHALKWTTDLGYGFDEVSDQYDSSGTGWRSDVVGRDGQYVLRSQFQLLF